MAKKLSFSATLITVLALISGASMWAQSRPAPDSPQARSNRIHEILKEAKSHEPANTQLRMAFEEIIQRQVNSFADFEKQCSDLQAIIGQNDAMEKRKRQMLTKLQYEFRDDPKMRPFFELLLQMEDVSDKMEPIWRGMIACSAILASSAQSEQGKYKSICIDPAYRQMMLLNPEIAKLTGDLQERLHQYGATLPPDVLQLIGN